VSSYFSKLLKAGDRLREFNFRQVSLNDTSRYNVNVPDDEGERIYFYMQENTDKEWKIEAAALPVWVFSSESLLSEAIEENRKMELLKKK
jgi:hypothetical protein